MDTAENYLMEASAAYNSENFTLAIEQATLAITAGCTAKEAWQIRGLSCSNVNQFAQAISDFNYYLELVPNDAVMKMKRGIAYSLSGDLPNAIPDMSAYIIEHPNESSGYQNRGYTYLVMKKNKEAINDLTKAIELGGINAQAYFQRGVAFFNSRNFPVANKDFSDSLDIEPDNIESLYLRGLTYFFRKCYTESINDLSKVIYLDGHHSQARFYRMNVYLSTQKHKEAQQEADQMVLLKTIPFEFSYDDKILPVVSFEIRKNLLHFGLDTSELGYEEKGKRILWLKTNGKTPRPLANVGIKMDLPHGGIDEFTIKVSEAKWQ